MSERIHSERPSAPQRRRNKLLPAIIGTTLLLAVAGVWLQFFRAQPAVSQTDSGEAGKATLSSSTGSRVLAKVNGQSITYDVVARECVSRYGEEILDALISRLIVQQECERRGITVTAAEVEQEVAKTAQKFNLPLETWYTMLEAERKLTREQYHQDVIWPMLALKKLAGQQIQVTEEDMKIGFESNYGPRVKARMILINGNMRHANSIWEKCNANPDDFDRLAREYSADPNTRPLGGVIPPIRKHGNNKAVEEVAFRMKVGEISPVIQIPDAENRYVILKCEGFTDPIVTDIREVWDDLYAQLVEEKTQQAVAQVFTNIKKQARIDNFLTNKSTGGQKIQPTSGTVRPNAPQQGVQRAAAEVPFQK